MSEPAKPTEPAKPSAPAKSGEHAKPEPPKPAEAKSGDAAKPGEAAKSDAPAAPAAAKSALPVMIGVVVGALLAGGALGKMVVGPMMVHPKPAAVHAAATPEPEKAETGKKGEKDDFEDEPHGKKGEHGKRPMFRLDNVIVNPAGTDGSRYLMVTVAFAVRNEEVETRLREQEVQVRDAVVTILEYETLESLTRPGARDSVRSKIEVAIGPMAGGERNIKVYLPQFILQ